MKPLFLLLGILFGFLLSRAGATTFDFYAQLFMFEHLQLLFVICGAVMIGIPGVQVLRRVVKLQKGIITGEPINYAGKAPTDGLRGVILGSLILGLGWGLAGVCPGTSLVMLGEGKLAPLFAIAGILLGTYLYGLQKSRSATP